ncbi:hypothetical protein QVD17_34032 [Tagetes erecta]|uniref:Uncharacterized protein n=1 Tax=Tagetes erecta TaxID=13708 RepID=A0AAD8K1M5_TARER|nr:hypothetical protein QVD17_34032 [Tagetes erecta]
MGCFVACFNSSKNRKQTKRKHNKATRKDQKPRSQNLVQDDVSLVQSIKDKPWDSLQELRGKSEEPLSLSNRKRVTFDTNVTTYEHVEVYDSTEFLLEKNEKGETFPKSDHTHSHSGSQTLNGGSYPPNYRYGNCVESDDEVQDSDYEDENDSCLDDEEDYDDEDESVPVPISSSETGIESCLSPVLKPVANLAQWKALKSKVTVTQPPKQLNFDSQKENFSYNQETAVDASLNWMVSSQQNTPNNKRAECYNFDFEPISSGKSYSQESTVTSVKSIEDRPIIGAALTADELKQFSGSSCTPKKSPGRNPDDMFIIGSVGSYWSTGSAQSLSSVSSYKGIPNATSKYREDKKVNWQNVSFETRLERALNEDVAEC